MARKRKPQPRFLKDGDRYIYLTGEAPAGFDGILSVGWSGIPAVESVEPLDRLKGASEIDADDVPDDVYDALVDAGVCEDRDEPEPEPEPEPTPRRRRRKSEPVETDDDRFDCWTDHVAAGTDMMTACAASGFLLDDDEPPQPKPKKVNPPPKPTTLKEDLTGIFWVIVVAVVLGIVMNLG